jgi:hypothetical protein
VKIGVQERVEINAAAHQKSEFNKLSKVEESKQQLMPAQQVQEVESAFATPRKPTPKSDKKLVKEESKSDMQEETTSKISAPLEIKKMIDSAILSKEAILESINFPSSKNALKVLQYVREISVTSIRKIQSSIQRIKATEKKLKELQNKTKESLKKKGFKFDHSSSKNHKAGKVEPPVVD